MGWWDLEMKTVEEKEHKNMLLFFFFFSSSKFKIIRAFYFMVTAAFNDGFCFLSTCNSSAGSYK